MRRFRANGRNKGQIEVGNIAQHFYNEGPELMVRLEVTEKGMQAIVESWATMN